MEQVAKVLQLEKVLSDDEVDRLAGQFVDESHYDVLVDEQAVVYKPDGSVLLKLCKRVIPAGVCRKVYPVLRKAATETDNRGMAGGTGPVDPTRMVPDVTKGPGGEKRVIMGQRILRGGRLSNTRETIRTVESGIVGYFDRYARIPYCRQTAFNLNHPEKFQAIYPYVRLVDRVFQEQMPERYEAQMGLVRRTSPDFHISGTAFTTITVNRNFRTAVHKDVGDLSEGFGVMTAFRSGAFEGFALCFPKYRVAAVMRTGDVLLADVHEWHGNTPVIGMPGRWERVSCVFYYRRKMAECGTAVEELERAKRRQRGDPLYAKK